MERSYPRNHGPTSLVTGFAYFGCLVSLYLFSLFLPTIMTGLGYKGPPAQLHTVPPYVPAVVLTIIVAYYSDHLKARGPFILCFLSVTIAGYILLKRTRHDMPLYSWSPLGCIHRFQPFCRFCRTIPADTTRKQRLLHFNWLSRTASTHLPSLEGKPQGAVLIILIHPQRLRSDLCVHSKPSPWLQMGPQYCLSVRVLGVGPHVLYCSLENRARRDGRRQSNLKLYQELRGSAPIGDRPNFRFII